MNDNDKPGSDGGNGGGSGGGNPWMKSLLIWVGVLVGLALFVTLVDGRTTTAAAGNTIAYSTFLDRVDGCVPPDLEVHLVLDNASTHKTPAVKKWLLAHPRFLLHFTPTSAS